MLCAKMFLRIAETKDRGKSYRYLKLVEGYRDPDGRSRQRVICTLGRVEELAASGKLDAWRRVLDRVEGKAALGPAAVGVRQARAFGGPYVLEAIWRELGLPELFREAQGDKKLRFDAALAVEAMVLNRLLAPRSKLAVQRWAPRMALGEGEAGELGYQHYLRALDLLHAGQRMLEEELFLKVSDLFGLELDLVFYDVTSSYFEGAGCELARHGHSRDHRSDRPQLVLGLAVTREGLPIAHRVFAGNTADVTTVAGMVEELKGRFRIGRCLLVADRGMVSVENLQAIRETGYRYLIALKRRQGELVRGAIGDGGMDGYGEVQDGLWAKEVAGPDGDRLIVCHSAERSEEERGWREELIAETEAELGKLRKRSLGKRPPGHDELVEAATRILRSSYGYRYLWYRVEATGELAYGRKEDVLAEEVRRDGKFVLRTNDQSLGAADAALAYKQLQRVERGFRELKDFLKLRPIRHWRRERVEAHVGVCVLAYLLEMVLEQKLARGGLPMTAQAALEALEPVKQVLTEVNGRRFLCLTDWPQQAGKVLRALGLDTPPKTIALNA